MADLDNGRTERIASEVGASGSVIWPKWSSDGAWIAFERGPFDQAGGSHGGSIWIVHQDGSGMRRLVDELFDVDLGTVDW